MELNPPGQYADDRNLHARQRLWRGQVPSFDVTAWVLDLAGLTPGTRVLDAGCGNGIYLRALRERRIRAVGTALPVRDGAFGVVLAAHLLDLVPDRGTAIRELHRVLAPGGTCVAVTNGAQHLRSLRELIERVVGVEMPGWRMSAPTGSAFTLDNAVAQLGVVFRR
jgi:SAM-dependent methyltransferase